MLPLVQLGAVTGVWGLSFVVAWFASWGNSLLEEWDDPQGPRSRYLVFPAMLALVLVAGQLRLVTTATEAPPVTIATVTPPDVLERLTAEDLALFQRHFMKQDVDEDRLRSVRERLEATYPELLRLTRREARQGARIVYWPEASVVAFGTDRQEDLLRQLKALAREEGIFLGVSLALVPEDPRQLNENKVILVGPDGSVRGTYLKTHLVPHLEEPFTRAGDGAIGTVDSPFGRLATVICYDLDNPRFVAQVGGRDVALLFAPSGDWPAIKYVHAAMARIRAVELGIPLVRPANHGLSQIVDTRARALVTMDHDATAERVLRAAVVPGGVATPYSRLGDAFAWLCVAAWLPVALLSSIAPPRSVELRLEARTRARRLG